MAITQEKKNEIKAKLETIAKESESVTFANFHGLNMPDTSSMRQALKAKGVDYYVAKKSLIRLAFENAEIKGELPELDGEVAVVSSKDDALAPAREMQNYVNKHKKKLALVGGVFDGTFQNKEEIIDIASIPSLDGLRGMFVNVINSPIQRMAIVMSQVAEQKS